MTVTSNGFTLPVFNAPGIGGSQLSIVDTGLPSIEDGFNPFFPLSLEGWGFSTVLLAYLTENWLRLHNPPQGFSIPIVCEGSGEVDMAARFPEQSKINFVRLSIRTPLKYDGDLLFGKVPIYYLGMCGFGISNTQQLPFQQLGAKFFSLFASQEVASSKGKACWINHLDGVFYPEHPTQDTFWWHLKEGIFADASIVLHGLGVGCTATTGEIGNYQHFNPLAGGWRTIDGIQGMFDGAGQPI